MPTKPISRTEIEKLELVEDGKQAQRFEELAKKLVNVPKKDIEEKEKKEARKKK